MANNSAEHNPAQNNPAHNKPATAENPTEPNPAAANPAPGSKALPAHIQQALLAGAGGASDTAGQSWEGRDLSGEGNPLHQFDGDDGLPNEALQEALDALKAGYGPEDDVVEALADARVFVPIVAQTGHTEIGEHGHLVEKEADMALVMIAAPDGRTALPVFSSVDRLTDWHPEARPVAVYAPRAALSAVDEGAQLLVLDPGANVTFVVRRPAVWALAQQRVWLPSYRDDSLAEPLQEAVSHVDGVGALILGPADGIASRAGDGTVMRGGGHGPELAVTVVVNNTVTDQDVSRIVSEVRTAVEGTQEVQEKADSLTIRVAQGG
ncbi:SseB family protein [Pseudoglutamicibacter albus]|uniref:SseB family protein n=1 Tax=Pseudoglutamicibacter albus TaxID=98671 RepID=UPI0009FE2D5C|nr:SseB family protein [Pseudoglutamicibacter albus]MCG7304517.1 SseB family protein [Pseudoglutamicibacter albus]